MAATIRRAPTDIPRSHRPATILTPDTVKARLMQTATKNFPSSSSVTDPTTGITYTSYYDMFTIGAGYLDVWAALNDTDVVASGTTAASPAVTYDSITNTVGLL